MISHIFIDHGMPAKRGVRITRAMLALAFGLFWLGFGGYMSLDAWRKGEWTQSTCTIVHSDVTANLAEVHEKFGSYNLRNRFRYRANAQDHEAWDEEKFEDVAEADQLAEERAVGSSLPCWINNANPDLAKLDPQRPWAVHLFFAGTIMANALLLYLYVIPQCRATVRKPATSPERKAKQQRGLIILLFLGMSAWLTWGFIVPLINSIRASTWPKVPCTIDSGTLAKEEVHGEVALTLYQPDVLYHYTVNGKSYRSNCYSYLDGGTPFRAWKQADADEFAEHTQAICRVDPDNPRHAVLKIGPGPSVLVALFPLGMVVLSAVALLKKPEDQPRFTSTAPSPQGRR